MNDAAPYRDLCTDCGISRSSNPSRCGRACQFIRPDYPSLEQQVHGRSRGAGDELFFGVHQQMLRARLQPAIAGAQWTGIATRLGERLLEGGHVDAILTVKPHPDDRWRPEPVLVTEAAGMAECRGMRMGYAPLLALLEPAIASGHTRIGIIGIPCQVYALRALQDELGLDELYVIGTPCSDNTTTERFHEFLGLLSERPDDICYLEFRADFKVEIRFDDGELREIPFLSLPISKLPSDFFPLTCRTCVDYTNALSDITVGYMAGRGDQWLVIRNEKGAFLRDLLGSDLESGAPTSAGKREGSVKGFIENTERAAGGMPLRRMPDWLRPLVSWLMPRIGPRGLEFARARVEMKAAESVLHLRREQPARMKHMIPAHVWQLLERYSIRPEKSEIISKRNRPTKSSSQETESDAGETEQR